MNSLESELILASKMVRELDRNEVETTKLMEEAKNEHAWKMSINLVNVMWENNNEMDLSFFPKDYQTEILRFRVEEACLTFEYPDFLEADIPKTDDAPGDEWTVLTATSPQRQVDQIDNAKVVHDEMTFDQLVDDPKAAKNDPPPLSSA